MIHPPSLPSLPSVKTPAPRATKYVVRVAGMDICFVPLDGRTVAIAVTGPEYQRTEFDSWTEASIAIIEHELTGSTVHPVEP